MGEETIITESEVPKLLNELNSNTIALLDSQKYQEALEFLAQSEELLEAVTTQGGTVDNDIVLVTLHNQATAYQRLGLLDEWANYLDGWLFNAKNRSVMEHDQDPLCPNTRKWKYMWRTNIQLWAIYSQLNRHDDALARAKNAIRISHNIIKEIRKGSYDLLAKVKKQRTGNRSRVNLSQSGLGKQKSSASEKYSSEHLQGALPILDHIEYTLINQRQTNAPKSARLDHRSALGVHRLTEHITTFNIGDIMSINSMQIFEVKDNQGLISHITRDGLFQILCLLAVSYFCVSTELRFLHGITKSSNKEYLKQAEVMSIRSVDIANQYLPSECPLAAHIKLSYTNHFNKKDRPPLTDRVRMKRNSARRVTNRSVQKARTPFPDKTIERSIVNLYREKQRKDAKSAPRQRPGPHDVSVRKISRPGSAGLKRNKKVTKGATNVSQNIHTQSERQLPKSIPIRTPEISDGQDSKTQLTQSSSAKDIRE